MIKNKDKIADKAAEEVLTIQQKAEKIAQAKKKMTDALNNSLKKKEQAKAPTNTLTKEA